MPRISAGEQEFVSSQLMEDGALPGADEHRDENGTHVIDARGLSSPLAILRAHRALRRLPTGQLVKVLTGSRQTVAEFQALVKYVVGYELVSQEENDGAFVHLLRRRR